MSHSLSFFLSFFIRNFFIKVLKPRFSFTLNNFLCFFSQVFWIAVTHSTEIEKNPSKLTVTFNQSHNESMSVSRTKREAASEYTIIKHKSRPSKRHPGYRSRRRPKPKPVYGPPNFSYGSPISDYTLGYTTNGKKTKNGPTFPYSNSETNFESDFSAPLKTNLYSGHNSYESTFKTKGNGYISPSSSGLLPSLPIDNYGTDPSLSYTPPPINSYPNQGFKNFGEPPGTSKIHDLTGSGTHNIKSIPPSTNYGVPVAPIHQQSQLQNKPTVVNKSPQDSYIANLYQSFSTPVASQSQNLNNFPNLQPTYPNPSILTNAGIAGLNAAAGINQNSAISNTNFGNLNVNPSVSDPSIANILNRFNQNALNTLTYKSYATSQPPQVKYVPASVTISSSKEITLNRNPSAGKFAEPPPNYVSSYQTPITSYDVPIQHDASKTTYNIDEPENQFQPTLYKSPSNSWNQLPSTTTERHKYLPPTLPTVYDHNQFNSFSNENDYSSSYSQHSDFLDSDGDYGPFLDVPHESKKIPKTKLTKTYAGTSLKSEDSSIESVEIPSDEYVDELISAPTTKKPRTRRRRPRPTAHPSTTPHILDTEDLRDAFSSGTVQYSLSVNPNGKSSRSRSQSKVANDKNFVLLSSANTNRSSWSRPYPKRPESSFDPINDVKEFLRTDSVNNNRTKGIEILSIQKSKSHSYYAGTVSPTEQLKQNGINARLDQPKYDDSMFNVVSTNVRMGNKSKLAASVTGSRRTKKQNFDESGEVEDDKTIDPIFWNGLQLPDNHKLAKRIA